MINQYEAQYQKYLSLANDALEQACADHLPEQSEVACAARYSLLSGGKRVRAVLALATSAMLGGDLCAAAKFASAVEMLHCYSLIHDDLPCMDDDDFRRGKLSCHKQFNEAIAVLAGDLLLTESFAVIASADVCAEMRVNAIKALAAGAGSCGMIYGQELDMLYETKQATEPELLQIHRNKTGALINAAVQLGTVTANASEAECRALEEYAFRLGLVFQIVDDVLDETSTQEALGKPIGSDRDNGKTTFVTLHGVEGAMSLAKKINAENCLVLQTTFGEKASFLVALAEQLLTRKS